jgi:hypothetical protein
MKMNQYKIGFLLLVVCCWCWTAESNVIAPKKPLGSYTTEDDKSKFTLSCSTIVICFLDIQMKSSKSVLDCDQYKSDNDILNHFPFSIITDLMTLEEGESSAEMDDTGTFVTRLRLRNTGNNVPEITFCLKNLDFLLITDMNFLNGTNYLVLSVDRCY